MTRKWAGAGLVCLALASAAGLPALAADRLWQGGSGDLMAPQNWAGGVAPVAGDRLIFDGANPGLPLRVGTSLPALGGIDSKVELCLYGEPLRFTDGATINVRSRSLLIASDVTFGANVTIATSDPNYASSVSIGDGISTGSITCRGTQGRRPRVTFSGGTATISAGSKGSVWIIADIVETAATAAVVSGNGILMPALSGPITSTATTLDLFYSDALAAPGGTIAIRGAGRLALRGTPAETTPAPHRIGRAIDLGSDPRPNPSLDIKYAGGLAGALTYSGPQQVFASADFLIDGRVSGSGELTLAGWSGVGPTAGAVLTNRENAFTGGLRVRGTVTTQGDAIPDGNDVVVATDGSFAVNGSEAVRSLACAQFGTLRFRAGAGELRIQEPAGTLTDCTLAMDVPASFTASNLTLIRNASGRPFTGTFRNLPEAAPVTVGTAQLYITYRGGTGGDVMLLTTPLIPVTATQIYSGTYFALRGGSSNAPIAAQVVGANGMYAVGLPVTFTVVTPGCGSFSGASTATAIADAQGIARAPAFTAGNTTAICRIRAQASGVATDLDVLVFNASEVAVTASPSAFDIATTACGYAGCPSPPNLAAKFVVTSLGRALASASVTFNSTECGRFGSGTSARVLSDSTGTAMVWYWDNPKTPGQCQVEARLDGTTVRALFDVTSYDPAATTLSPSSIAVPASSSVPFDLEIRAADGHALRNVPVSWRVAPANSAATATLSSVPGNTGATGKMSPRISTSGYTGTYQIIVTAYRNDLVLAVKQSGGAAPPVAPNVQDMWWGGIEQNGWGVSIVQHGDTLFVVIFGYGATGSPLWYVMPGGSWDASRRSYSGSAYSPRGTPFYAYDAARLVLGEPVGTVKLSFSDADHATLTLSTYSAVLVSKSITRQSFGPVAATNASYGDMWWGGVAQNGWGMAILQQYASLFSVWYTYDEAGMPRWYVMPAGTWTATGTYEGRLYRTTGSPWGNAYDARLFQVFDVGAFRLRFSGDNATFDYGIDGRTGSLPLQRQGF